MKKNKPRKQKRKPGFSNKKGSVILDSSVAAIILVAFAIICVISYVIYNQVDTMIQSDTTMGTVAKTESASLLSRMPSTLDSGIILAFSLLWIMTIVASFFINSHPLFFVVTFIMLIFLCIAFAMLGNSYEEIMSDSEFAGMDTTFPMSYWLFTHFLPAMICIAFSILFAIYLKNKVIS